MGIYVWGTGCGASELIEAGLEATRITAFVDSFPMGDTFLGKPVLLPKQLPLRDCELLIITARHADAIGNRCRELGIRIPEQLSVIGNDNVSWSGAAAAGLSSFTQPTFETGRMAVKLLCQACDTAAPVGTVMLTGEFIERNSVQHLL